MEITVLGCSGSRGKGLRTTAFLVDNALLLDAGTITEALSLEQCAQINHILITHAHIDHIGDLPFLVESVLGLRKEPIYVHAIDEVIEDISSHIFNDHVWPDFSEIPSAKEPILSYRRIKPLESITVGSYNVLPIPVNHIVPTVGYLIDDGKTVLAFAADPYFTELFWQKTQTEQRLGALIVEASFPNRLEEVAEVTKHLTPTLMAEELKKLKRSDVDVYVTHMKPPYRRELIVELKKLSRRLPIKILEDDMKIIL